jgi:parvulin-like peptidyl-prolyl isomerase
MSRTTRIRGLFEGEERQQLAVTVFFIAVIVAVILILLGAIGVGWYNDNIRPVARVGQTEIGPQLLRDRTALERWRISRDDSRITQAQINAELTAEEAQARKDMLDQRAQALTTDGLEDLVDLLYQSQLASVEGITVSDADVDARIADDFAGIERRHVLELVVKPTAADAESGPSAAERSAALDKAEAALAQIQSGRPFGDVAREFSTDPTGLNGGDIGVVSETGVADQPFSEELFKLDQPGPTRIVRGSDGSYRIGQVVEILPVTEEPGLRDALLKDMSEQSLRDIVRYEAASDGLKDKIITAALAATPEQARIAIITINGEYTGDPLDAQGEVNYSEIVFAPKDDLIGAPDLPPDDPAWALAKSDADAAFAELNAITDTEQRETRFAEIATDMSDAPSSADGGLQDFTTRSTPPDAVGVALFDTPHVAGELIAPVKADAGYYVLLFHERRASPEQRVKAVQDALAVPGADFNEVAGRLSEGPEKDDGGEIGWLTKDQLSPDLAEKVFALAAGQISEPLELEAGDAHYIVKVEEKGPRPLDANQIPDIRATAFENWYAEKKTQAENDGVIVRAGEDTTTDQPLEPGGDEP